VLIAVDTNVLLDQAAKSPDVLDALTVVRERLNADFIVPPTVLEELAFQALRVPGHKAEAAKTALTCMRGWGCRPLNVVPVARGITEQISLKLRLAGILPDEEVNDSFVLAEAALIGCKLLLSSDAHLLDAQRHPAFRAVLAECDVDGDELVIARPRDIAAKFFRMR
jgi:predicted nucleic acid-binding protein